ncbi:class I SAM-dependent methyltransferase [Paenibacillus sp. OSY-SE]|uniref:class I SAM-dependent methyltransferase n=1 Tax=Paenibacillus sp. OSY-SE TaxID=1196323 RepID=UPI00036A13BB|nr:class I SAM-dependent methyltransferase [Paenibacillus sp. OSY-SE]
MGTISVSEHYDLLIDENNDPVNDPEILQNYMDKWDGDLFIGQLNINHNSNALEIGAGTGRLALKVLKIGCKIFTGIDMSSKTIIRAKEHLSKYENCSLICGDYNTAHTMLGCFLIIKKAVNMIRSILDRSC